MTPQKAVNASACTLIVAGLAMAGTLRAGTVETLFYDGFGFLGIPGVDVADLIADPSFPD